MKGVGQPRARRRGDEGGGRGRAENKSRHRGAEQGHARPGTVHGSSGRRGQPQNRAGGWLCDQVKQTSKRRTCRSQSCVPAPGEQPCSHAGECPQHPRKHGVNSEPSGRPGFRPRPRTAGQRSMGVQAEGWTWTFHLHLQGGYRHWNDSLEEKGLQVQGKC